MSVDMMEVLSTMNALHPQASRSGTEQASLSEPKSEQNTVVVGSNLMRIVIGGQ